MIITIDGPVASGKSTIARLLAQKLGYYYLNTGMLYRALAYLILQKNISIKHVSESDIEDIISDISYEYVNNQEHIFYDGDDITSLLFSPAIDDAASKISAIKFVRRYADALQRRLAEDRNVVIDGRDSGSVVFKDADYKCYITASDEVRAQRWQRKQKQRGKNFAVQEALTCIKDRDDRDQNRPVSPLIIPQDAIVIENDGDNPEAVVKEISSFFI